MDSRKITPEGWHVPTLADWTELKNFLSLHHPNSIVKPLQSTSGWKDPGNGTDNYGFSALPGGHRSYSSGYYLGFGTSAHFWSSTKSSHNGAFCCRLHYLNSDILLGLGSHMRNGFAIRCLKDWIPENVINRRNQILTFSTNLALSEVVDRIITQAITR